MSRSCMCLPRSVGILDSSCERTSRGHMTSTATADRSEFRHILVSGTIVGAAIAAAVVVFLIVAWLLPAGVLTSILLMLIVLAGGALAAFLPASFATSRT